MYFPNVLRSDRQFSLPSLGVQLRTVALLHPRLRVHVVDNRGVVCEDALGLPSFPRVGQPSRPVLTVVLEGLARVTLPTGIQHWLREGTVAWFPKKNELVMRQEGARYRSIVIEYDDGVFGQRPTSTQLCALGPTPFAALNAWADELTFAPHQATMAALASRLFALLAQEGIALIPAPPQELAVELDPDTIELSATLDRALSRLGDRPARVDIEDEVAIRTRVLTDQIAAFHKRFGFNAEGWRDALLRRRILVGCATMSALGAKTEVVSAALGYSSPTVFCRAMAKSALPSPANIASAVKHLR